jgi:hypothetical protein
MTVPEKNPRMLRLLAGNYQFGHAGMHRGNGSENCPVTTHHHCDEFCKQPTFKELWEARIKPAEFESLRRDSWIQVRQNWIDENLNKPEDIRGR